MTLPVGWKYILDSSMVADHLCSSSCLHHRARPHWYVFLSAYTPPSLLMHGSLIRTAQLAPEFKKRDVKLIGLSANDIASHNEWIKDVNEVASGKYSEDVQLTFPIIGDKDRSIATTYDMLDALDKSNVDAKGMPFTVRTVFISACWWTSAPRPGAHVLPPRPACRSRPEPPYPHHDLVPRLDRPQLYRDSARD